MKQGEHDKINQEVLFILSQIRELIIRVESFEDQLQESVQSKPKSNANMWNKQGKQ